MWWPDGVTAGIQACQARSSVLVVLVEPKPSALEGGGRSEKSAELLSRLATRTMHRVTFSDPVVLAAVADSQAICLKFPTDETNPDFASFRAFFNISGTPPNLYFISPLTGQTLVLKTGHVSPKIFLDALISTTKQVSGRDVAVADNSSQPSASQPKSTTQQLLELLADEEPDDEKDTAPTLANTSTNATDSSNAPSEPRKLPTTTIPEQKHVSAPSSAKAMQLSGAANASDDDARLLARLPGGAQAQKSFPKTAKFAAVRSWLSEEARTPGSSLLISTAFPRRVFDASENPKMLSELGLCPSETLFVAFSSKAADTAPAQVSPVALPSSSGVRSYATSALSVVGSFFRSFVTDGPNTSATAEEAEQAQVPGRNAIARRRGGIPPAVRIERNRTEDDENLLSNGNSTQYGWNPRDEEDEQR